LGLLSQCVDSILPLPCVFSPKCVPMPRWLRFPHHPSFFCATLLTFFSPSMRQAKPQSAGPPCSDRRNLRENSRYCRSFFLVGTPPPNATTLFLRPGFLLAGSIAIKAATSLVRVYSLFILRCCGDFLYLCSFILPDVPSPPPCAQPTVVELVLFPQQNCVPVFARAHFAMAVSRCFAFRLLNGFFSFPLRMNLFPHV